MEQKEPLGMTLLGAVALIWGTGFIATQIAIDGGYDSSFIMMGRFVTAAIMMGLLFCKDLRGMGKEDLIAGGVVGIFLFLGFTLQTYGLVHTTPSNSAFITATKVMIVPLLGLVFLRDKPSTRTMVASLACLVGITALSLNFDQGFSSFGYGELLTFLCAVSFAFHTFSLGYFVRRVHVKRLIFLQLAVAAFFSTVLFMVQTGGDLTFVKPDKGLFAILYLGVLATGIAYILQTVGQKYVVASKAALIIATESLFASILSVLLGFESVSIQLLIGGSLIMGSILITEMRMVKKLPR